MRKAAGISKTTFSLMTGISRPYLNDIEDGSANPTVDMLERIANGLGVSPARLFPEDGFDLEDFQRTNPS